MTDSNQGSEGKVVQFRLKKKSLVSKKAELPFMLQLMASLEGVRASIRWYDFASKEKSGVRRRDEIMAVIAGAGWCAEAFRLLKAGVGKGVLSKGLVSGNSEVAATWELILSDTPSPLIKKMHRIRDMYFAHSELEVMTNFIEQQAGADETEVFLESDENGKFLNTRYIWPWAAFGYDLIGMPGDEGYGEDERAVIRDIGEMWMKTANLLSAVLATLSQRLGFEFERIEEAESQA